MMNKSSLLTVLARLQAKPGKESELRQALLGLINPTRLEPGCVRYDLHESNEKPGLFFFYEIWKSSQALAQHFETHHLRDMQKKAPELLSEPLDLQYLSMISPAKE